MLIGFVAALLVGGIGGAFIAWVRWELVWEERLSEWERAMRDMAAAFESWHAVMIETTNAFRNFGDAAAKTMRTVVKDFDK